MDGNDVIIAFKTRGGKGYYQKVSLNPMLPVDLWVDNIPESALEVLDGALREEEKEEKEEKYEKEDKDKKEDKDTEKSDGYGEANKNENEYENKDAKGR